MDIKGTYSNQSMDDIVFDRRNKSYGAYMLRGLYSKNLLKAIGISVGVFVFSLYTPKMAKAIGLFSDKGEEILDTTTIVLSAPPSIKEDAPPPPPPPPEVEVQRPTEKFMEMLAVKKEEAEDPPPTIEDLKDKDIGTEKIEGTATDDPPPIVEEVVGTGEVIDDKIYVNVDQKAQFIGGDEALAEFLHDNLDYPEEAKMYEQEGTTIVSFIVTADGTVIDVKVGRTSGVPKLDAEAVRVIKRTSGRFKPGKINGKAVKSYCQLPITFELEEE
jgi:protein TonB